MIATWFSEELERIGSANELEIAVKRANGTVRRWLPIWVVCVGEQVYVRTWYRRDNGWFGTVLDSRRAQIRVPGLEVDVHIEEASEDGSELRAGVDAAYGVKYGHHGGTSVGGMVTDDAAATTLRLIPDRSPDAE